MSAVEASRAIGSVASSTAGAAAHPNAGCGSLMKAWRPSGTTATGAAQAYRAS